MHTPLQIAAFYVALNALIALVLAMNVSFARLRTNTTLGDGGHESLLQAIRAHGNNIEYVPLALIALVTMALLQTSVVILHIVGILLTVGRVVHATAMLASPGRTVGRFIGSMLTNIAVIVAVIVLIMKAVI